MEEEKKLLKGERKLHEGGFLSGRIRIEVSCLSQRLDTLDYSVSTFRHDFAMALELG